MRRLLHISTYCMLLLTSLVSCTIDVPLCMENHPHEGMFDVRYNWSNALENVPDSMFVLATRPIRHIKYIYQTTSLVANNKGRLIMGPDEAHGIWEDGVKEEIKEENGVISIIGKPTKVYTGQDSITLRGGEYNLMCYNGDMLKADDSGFGFNMEAETLSDSVWISYRPLKSLADYPAGKYQEWEDHNAYSQFLPNLELQPIYCGFGNVEIPTEANLRNTKIACTLVPKPISQRLHINFTCRPKEEGIVVDSIFCELSGVASSMQVATRRLDVSKTYKTLYTPTFTPTGAGEASELKVKGTINVSGVVRNQNTGTITGPGILQTVIYIHYDDENGVHKQRTLQASINLFHTLSANPSVQYDRDGYVIQKTTELTLNIENVLQLTKNKIEMVDNLGGDTWEDVTDPIIVTEENN